jgi:tetratricopeptide (TPR) repeat protein
MAKNNYFGSLILAAILCLCPFTSFAVGLDEAYQDYIYGNYQDAIDKAKLEESDKAFYLIGLCYMKLDDNDQAREFLTQAITSASNTAMKEKAQISIADTYFLEEDFVNAGKKYHQLLDNNISSNYLSLIYLRLAQIASKDGRWKERNDYLNLIKTKFPSSVEMKFVHVLEGYGDFFTIQVGAFSSKYNASSFQSELEAKGYSAYMVAEQVQANTLYKVRVGKYNDREAAHKVFLELLDLGYPAKISP